MTLSSKNSNKDCDFVGWVIKTSWLIYFRSVKFHYVKETHMMLVALVKIVVASQRRTQRKKSFSRFADNWTHRLGLESWVHELHYANELLLRIYASDLPFKNCCKLAKQAETNKNRFWLWLSIVWETRKLTLYQNEEKVTR